MNMLSAFLDALTCDYKIRGIVDFRGREVEKRWFISKKLFGLFYVECFKSEIICIDLHSHNIGYDSKEMALCRISKELGQDAFLRRQAAGEILCDEEILPGENYGHCVVKKAKRCKYTVSYGFYVDVDDGHVEFWPTSDVVGEYDTPAEALMHAELLGITVENAERLKRRMVNILKS